MNPNIGAIDRVLRLVFGTALISFVFVGPQTPWGWIGMILIVTALVSSCPLYAILGIKTCKVAQTNP